MSGTKIDRRAALASAAANQNDELIARAAKRADWAGAALASAAEDLSDAHGGDGSPLAGLAEVVLEEAARVTHLAEDIESQRHSEDLAPSKAIARSSSARRGGSANNEA